MSFGPENLLKLQAHLRSKGVTHAPCPRCGHGSWNVDGPFLLPQLLQGNMVALHSGLALVALVCEHCAYTEHYAWSRVVENLPEQVLVRPEG